MYLFLLIRFTNRDNMKLASFYVACCKLFEQMESYKEVSIYNTVFDLHKAARGPIFTLVIAVMTTYFPSITWGSFEVIIFKMTGAIQETVRDYRQGSHS